MNLKNYQNCRVVVTGASGYIGSMLTQKLLDSGAQVLAISRTPPPFSHPGLVNLSLDLSGDFTVDFLNDGKPIDVIFHLAGQTSHYQANQNPSLDWQKSVHPLLRLLECLSERSMKPLVVFASTVTVYGLGDTLPFTESNPTSPVSIYDAHKLACENYLNVFSQSHAIPYVCLRLANVYGYSLKQTHQDRGILNLMVQKARNSEPLKILGTGEWLRDYIHVEDVSNAFWEAGLIRNPEFLNQVYNVCTGTSHVFKEVVQKIATLAQVYLKVSSEIILDTEWIPTSPIDIRQFKAKPSAFIRATSWKPSIDLAVALEKMIRKPQ